MTSLPPARHARPFSVATLTLIATPIAPPAATAAPGRPRLLRASLALLAAAVLAGCSTVELPPRSQAALAPAVAAKVLPAVEPAGPALPPAISLPVESGRDVAGAPVDPLEPEKTVNLDDRAARIDLWARVRTGFGMPEVADADLVARHEQWYASRPDYVQRMTERAGRYLYHVVEEIERRNMPTELALLPFIESAFNPRAMSVAKASGMWQFIPSTGKDYSLKQNLFRDDRRDVMASTRAALDYLGQLHRMFGDWQLALAAYNWGQGNVMRAIKRNEQAGLPTDYASLRMPDETRNYLPKLQAVKNIVSRPDAYGLALTPVANHPYFIAVPIQRDIDAALAARLAGLSMDEFHALNPSQNKPVIFAAGTPQVLLPYDNAERFIQNLERHRGPLASWTAWVVPRTMRPADAARQLGMSEDKLRELNKIPPRMLVKAGSTLLVPRSEHRASDLAANVVDNAMMALAPDVPPLKRKVVSAGKRDTLASIARRYKLDVDQVLRWNKGSAQARLARGTKVVLYVPTARGGRTAVAEAQSTRSSSRASARARDDDDRRSARAGKASAPAKATRTAKASSGKAGTKASAARSTRVAKAPAAQKRTAVARADSHAKASRTRTASARVASAQVR